MKVIEFPALGGEHSCPLIIRCVSSTALRTPCKISTCLEELRSMISSRSRTLDVNAGADCTTGAVAGAVAFATDGVCEGEAAARGADSGFFAGATRGADSEFFAGATKVSGEDET